MRKFISKEKKETEALGVDFAKNLKPGRILALYGELGSGKTTFSQGIIKGLGIKKRIISPTFIIVRKYELEDKIKAVYHLDLYRIGGEEDLDSIGFNELIKDKEGVVLIEWADKIKERLPKERIEVHFKYVSENEREINIEYFN